MITNHIWKCKNCNMELTVNCNHDDQKSKERLAKFEGFVTKHCINQNHEVIHKEKEHGVKFKYV